MRVRKFVDVTTKFSISF